MSKITLPGKIEKEMTMWRNGLCSMPASYIAFHADLAKMVLLVGENSGMWFISGVPTLQNTGWFDGMRAFTVQVWVPLVQKMVMMQWDDGNQEFFVKERHGSSPFRLFMITEAAI